MPSCSVPEVYSDDPLLICGGSAVVFVRKSPGDTRGGVVEDVVVAMGLSSELPGDGAHRERGSEHP